MSVHRQECNEDNVKYAEQFTDFDEFGTCENCEKENVALTDFDTSLICADCFVELIRKL